MPIPADAPVDLKIRKILGARVAEILPELATFKLIEWPNFKIDKSKALKANGGPGYYVKVTYHPTDERPRTMGPNPRVEKNGFMRVGINTELGVGEDAADLVAGDVIAGFPYSVPIEQDGLSIEITRRLRPTANEADNWYYLPLSIYWTLWRET